MTENTVMRQKTVRIHEGKIAEIGEYTDMHKNAPKQVIDGTGKYLMPGLADMHVHLSQTDKLQEQLLLNVAAGVVHVRAMNSKENPLWLRSKIDSIAPIQPYVHFGSIVKKDLGSNPIKMEALMQLTKTGGMEFIKLFSISDEAMFDALMKAAKRHGIKVCGHYPLYVQNGNVVVLPIGKVLQSGLRSIEHLGGYDRLATDVELEEALNLTLQHGVYNCPTLDWDVVAYDLQYPDAYKKRITYELVPKKYRDAWESAYATAIEKAGGAQAVLADKEKYQPVFERKQKLLKHLSEKQCLLLMGSDAGNLFQLDGFNMYEEMQRWAEAGVDNYTILRAATANAALFFDEQKQWGTVQTGKNADLILLSKNPLEDIGHIATVEMTFVGGKVYQKADLLKKL